jgi:hypothetical protein
MNKLIDKVKDNIIDSINETIRAVRDTIDDMDMYKEMLKGG